MSTYTLLFITPDQNVFRKTVATRGEHLMLDAGRPLAAYSDLVIMLKEDGTGVSIKNRSMKQRHFSTDEMTMYALAARSV